MIGPHENDGTLSDPTTVPDEEEWVPEWERWADDNDDEEEMPEEFGAAA